MPRLIVPITSDGPLVDVMLEPSVPRQQARQARQRPLPTPIAVRMLIDTGANHTCIADWIVSTLSLVVVAQSHIRTATTTSALCNKYDVSISLPGDTGALTVPRLAVLAVNLGGSTVDGLIGRDVLSRCRFHYDGPAATVDITF